MRKKSIECWHWYETKDKREFLRVAYEYQNSETRQRFYMIQEYRSGQILQHGLTRAQAYELMRNECIIPV